MKKFIFILFIIVYTACHQTKPPVAETEAFPVCTTDTTLNDTDDPAIWYNKIDPGQSLILGTDKGDSTGGIFVFDLKGKLIPSLCLTHLARPNNIDIEYGLNFNGDEIDIAAFTERGRKMLRIISLPDCRFIDNGGIPVFEDEADSLRYPMGIALYKDRNNNVFAFVTRKKGPVNGYIYQYRLYSKNVTICAEFVRKFGDFSGKKEIEAIMVDDALGFVYYSDEGYGIRKYYADAQNGDKQLALFATSDIAQDHEGLALYKGQNTSGYIILSDQQANRLQIFNRRGALLNPHKHTLRRVVKLQTLESDGIDMISLPLNSDFPSGILVAMSANKTFQYYKAEDIIPAE